MKKVELSERGFHNLILALNIGLAYVSGCILYQILKIVEIIPE